ncbi:MAG: alpha/beta fold hydrolase [Polymorphobacter sp.]
MTITRHFVDVSNPDGSRRRVHYRRAGAGPVVVLVHQSPRSSAEYAALMADWAADFTCLAPDTPGFGESAPLPMPNPHVNDYADAVLAFLDAMGLPQAGAYGTHSGAITLITAAKRAAHRFTAIAANGYAVWTDAERADFGANYTPAFVPLPYGEHLAWVWHRIREQSWFFPWYAADDAHRLPMAHDDAATNHAMIMDILAAGSSYAQGYAAMLQAPRDLPAPGAPTPPVYISGRNGDPLQSHIDRLGPLPPGWAAEKLVTEAQVEAASRTWLLRHPATAAPSAAPPADQGFVTVPGLGQLHWIGDSYAETLLLHAPGSAAEMVARPGALAIDLPGHGLSVGGAAPPTPDAIAAALATAIKPLAPKLRRVEGQGASAAIAALLAARCHLEAPEATPSVAAGWPDLTPDRFGSHLMRAWGMARAEVAFTPWDAPCAANARAFDPAELGAHRLHRRALAALRAQHVPELLAALQDCGMTVL